VEKSIRPSKHANFKLGGDTTYKILLFLASGEIISTHQALPSFIFRFRSAAIFQCRGKRAAYKFSIFPTLQRPLLEFQPECAQFLINVERKMCFVYFIF